MTTKAELRDLLYDEFHRHRSEASVWDCPAPACPYYGGPCKKDCNCHTEAEREHIEHVLRVIYQND